MNLRRVIRHAPVAASGLALLVLTTAACGGTPEERPAAAGHSVDFDRKLAAEGKAIAGANGCLACHSVDGKSGVGPTWKGLYDHDVTVADGSKVRADDAYLRESIVNPAAKVVKGYNPNVMPAGPGQGLNDGQLGALVEYIKSLH